MKKITFKDGREAEIEIWNNSRLQKYIEANNSSTEKTGSCLHYEKFGFLVQNLWQKDIAKIKCFS